MKFFLLLIFVFFSFGGFAKTAYVNMVSAIESTKMGRRVKNRLEKSAETAQKQFKATELKIQKEEETLKKRRLCCLSKPGPRRFNSFSKKY